MHKSLHILESSLTKDEVRAFGELANALIFIEPTNIELGPDTITEISHCIQKDFLILIARGDIQLHGIRDSILGGLDNLIAEFATENEAPSKEKLLFRPLAESINRGNVDDYFHKSDIGEKMNFVTRAHFRAHISTDAYSAIGFTPALSVKHLKADPGYYYPNCAGRAIMEGAAYRMRLPSNEVFMILAPDHPDTIRIANGRFRKNYNDHMFQGYIKPIGHLFEFRPAPNDNILSQLSLIVNFDRAVIYEILENMEFLRQVSLGNVTRFLPKSRADMERIANENANLLQVIEWKKIQQKLFPDIAAYIQQNIEEWNHSIDYAAKLRRIFHTKDRIGGALAIAADQIFTRPYSKDEAREDMFSAMQQNKESVSYFLEEDIIFSNTGNEKMENYVKAFKEALVATVPIEDQSDCIKYLVAKLFDREPFV
jgi:hypothetical protein